MGTIQDQKIINAEIPLHLVESTQKLNFPDSGSSTDGGGIDGTSTVGSTAAAASNNNNIGPQFQGILSQLANDIDSTKSSMDTLAKANADTQKINSGSEKYK